MPTKGAQRGAQESSQSLEYDVQAVRRDFPILSTLVHGKPLVYFDNAATTQKPKAVLDAERQYYEQENANIHRGVHHLSESATRHYEQARTKVQQFLGARSPEEVIFTRGTTEAINLVAHSFVRPRMKRGDDVVITHLEHHSNIVPWQMVAAERKGKLEVAPINDAGEVDLEAFDRLLTRRTRLASVGHVSNALGTINPVAEMAKMAREKEVPILVDGAQAVPHIPVDVAKLGVDFYAMSGHKVYGPTGVGALVGRKEILEEMPPYQGGGDMIRSVTFEGTTYNDVPYKFEAGTPNIAGGIGLGVALDYVGDLGLDKIARHEHRLLVRATQALSAMKGIRLIGTAKEKSAVVSFEVEGVHPHDVGSLLDREGVAIRTGHHCAQPVMDRFGVPATCRASFGLYNTVEEVDVFVAALKGVQEIFR